MLIFLSCWNGLGFGASILTSQMRLLRSVELNSVLKCLMVCVQKSSICAFFALGCTMWHRQTVDFAKGIRLGFAKSVAKVITGEVTCMRDCNCLSFYRLFNHLKKKVEDRMKEIERGRTAHKKQTRIKYITHSACPRNKRSQKLSGGNEILKSFLLLGKTFPHILIYIYLQAEVLSCCGCVQNLN